MPRVLLLVPTATYRAPDFVQAARALGVDLIVGSEEAPVLGDRGVAIPLDDPDTAVGVIERLDHGRAVDAVVAVDDQGVLTAAAAGARLGFAHNPPDAVAATRDKRAMRERLAAGEVDQPAFGDSPATVGYPCVVKPTGLAGSRGVIRCDDEDEYDAAVDRIRAFWSGPLIVERYVPGVEVAVEAILRDGALTILALFDKPDPLVGPYFEETIYVTPSRLPTAVQAEVERLVARGATAIGLTEGPVHAEVRVDTDATPPRLALVEVAARTIGGLCARTLRFGAGIALEEVVLRHALGMDLGDLERAPGAAGVMMLPIPRAGVLRSVGGRDATLAVAGVVGLDITVPPGHAVVPLPEGDRYLGFLFARRHAGAGGDGAARRGHGPGYRHHLMIDAGTHPPPAPTTVLLVSTYELGHSPTGVATAAAALRDRGFDVRVLDLAVDDWDADLAAGADRVGISVPMHTAARLAHELAPRIDAPIGCFGLYAGMCGDIGAALVGRDPVAEVVRWVEGDPTVAVSAAVPARDLLPGPERYAHLIRDGVRHPVAATDASIGCAHRCRHCPVPVVYDGRIRITDVDTVLADVAAQVARGARHVTFGDPDFFNGVHHARRVVAALHGAFPDVTFDCTVKVEHVLRHADLWPELAASGCLFVISAFEAVDDRTLTMLDKGHTARDETRAIVTLRTAGIEPRPTWLPFTPWSTVDGIRGILEFVAHHDLIGNVDPVQYSIRLLVPEGSLLLAFVPDLGPWDPVRLGYRWTSPLDDLQARFAAIVEAGADDPPGVAFNELRALVDLPAVDHRHVTEAPRLSESWFCCAEPTTAQLRAV